MSNKARVDITLHNVTLAMLDAAGCDTSADVPLILIDAPARKLTLAQAAELHARLGALLAEQFDATLTSFRTRALNHGRIEHTDPVVDKPPREPKPLAGPAPLLPRRPLPKRPMTREELKLARCRTSLGLAICTLRLQRGWSQMDLARRSGLNNGDLSRLEITVRSASPPTLRALERAFELPRGGLDNPAQYCGPTDAAVTVGGPIQRSA